MVDSNTEVVVAGHICLDIIPTIREASGGMDRLFSPGKLVDVGAAVTSTGGAVSNTGIALHRLGVNVRLIGKIGADSFGRTILDILQGVDPAITKGMIVTEDEHSSYSIVISPPGIDRVFLHHTGTNDTFGNSDVSESQLHHARLFHFGYPPLMQRMHENEGIELQSLFQKVKRAGLTTSLDLAKPDPESVAGRADWIKILSNTLPYVDVFLPSFEEILYMLDRSKYDELESHYGHVLLAALDSDLLSRLSDKLIKLGAAVVAIKLGEYGLYMRTSNDCSRIQSMGACAPQSKEWIGRELLTPCYQVVVAGTTGAGDCTIAGFLIGLLRGNAPHEVLQSAVAVGACNVEQADATSGVLPWAAIEQRILNGWKLRSLELQLSDWSYKETLKLWSGPNNIEGDD